jgi:hypothetical protein
MWVAAVGLCACGSGQPNTAAPVAGSVASPSAPSAASGAGTVLASDPSAPVGYWPVTAAEKNGQAYSYDPAVVTTRSCESKAPIELRLGARRTPERTEVRLTIKNCTATLVRLLHGHNNPSLLSIESPGGAVMPSVDDRRVEKTRADVLTRDFARYAASYEQVAHEGYFIRAPDGKYAIKWVTHTHGDLVPGRYKLRVRLANTISEGFDENKQKTVAMPDAWVGTAQSNEITVDLP